MFDLIRDQLADILEIEPARITEGSSFAEDLDADSLALIELVEALEEELGERSVGFRIDDEDLEDLRTVRDAVDYVSPSSRRVEPGPRGRRRRRGWRASPLASGTASPTRPCSARPSRTAAGAASTAARPPTSGSSSSATPCSAWWWPSYGFRHFPELPEGKLAKIRAAVVNAHVLAAVASSSGWATCCCSGKGRRHRGAAPRRRSSPTPWRR